MDSREKGEDRYKVNKSLQARIHACLDAGTDTQGLERTPYQTQEPMIGFFLLGMYVGVGFCCYWGGALFVCVFEAGSHYTGLADSLCRSG